MKPGDWVEHLELPDRRGLLLTGGEHGASMILHGDRTIQSFTWRDLDRWWGPLSLSRGAPVPSWVREGALFFPRGAATSAVRAIVFRTRSEYVAYETFYGVSAFWLDPWDDFIRKWSPEKPLTAWERLHEGLLE